MPAEVVELLDLREIEAMWGVSENKIYRAVERGDLTRFGRPGRRKFYSLSELVALLGTPKHGPSDVPAKLSASDNGRNQQHFEFETSRAA